MVTKKISALDHIPSITDADVMLITDTESTTSYKISLSNIASYSTTAISSDNSLLNQLFTAIKTVDGTGSGLDADLLDGIQGSALVNSTHTSHSASDLAIGWYTIATNIGDRAIARFGIRDTDGGRHQSVVFYASHHFGAHSEITVLHTGRYSATPYRYIRIKEGGTYDGAMLQVYVDDANNNLTAYLLGDNFQLNGWVLKNWIPDGTNPGDLSNFAALTNVAAQVDLDQAIDGGIITTGPIYADGLTSQGRVWSENNDGAGSGLDADLLDGQHGSYYTNYTDTAIANLVDSSPATLDTLNELAAALGDDPNFATTVTNSIAGKVSKSGDTISGDLTVTGYSAVDHLVLENKELGDMSGDGTLWHDASEGLYHVAVNSSNSDPALLWSRANFTAGSGLNVSYNAQGRPTVSVTSGSGSSLDADTLDGQHGSYYQPASTAVTTTTITNYTLNPRFASSIGFSNDSQVLYFNDSTNENRTDYWASKDGFYVRGDGNNVDNVVLKSGNLDISQNAWIDGNLGVGGSIITDKYADSSGRVLTYDFSATPSSAVGDNDGYFDTGEVLELFSFQPSGNSQNYYVEGVVKIQSGENVETLFIRTAVRSNTRPDLSWSGQYERYSEPDYTAATPYFWANEIDGTGEIRLILKFTGSNIQDIECSFKVFQRSDYGEALTVTTNHIVDTLPTNFSEYSIPKRLELAGSSFLINGNEAWHAGNDGSGSGLDADTLDGQHGSYYQPASTAITTSTTFGGDVSGTYNSIVVANDSHTHDGRYYTESEIDTKLTNGSVTKLNNATTNQSGNWHTFVNDGGGNIGQRWNSTTGGTNTLVENGIAYELEIGNDTAAGNFSIKKGATSTGTAGETITWTTAFEIYGASDNYNLTAYGQRILTVADEGSGNGLDADTVDGIHASDFVRLNSTSANSNDYLHINRSSTNATLYVNNTSTGDIARFFKGAASSSTSGTNQVTITNSGDVTATGDINTTSDVRVKDNIETIENAVDKVKQIRGVTFTRTDKEDTEKRYAGVIAQEVQKVLPEVICETEGGLTVAYGNIIALLIEAIKEQETKINELKQLIVKGDEDGN